MPENGYIGTYLDEIAEKIVNEHGKDLESDNQFLETLQKKKFLPILKIP